jgi:hypothetical protein
MYCADEDVWCVAARMWARGRQDASAFYIDDRQHFRYMAPPEHQMQWEAKEEEVPLYRMPEDSTPMRLHRARMQCYRDGHAEVHTFVDAENIVFSDKFRLDLIVVLPNGEKVRVSDQDEKAEIILTTLYEGFEAASVAALGQIQRRAALKAQEDEKARLRKEYRRARAKA